MMPYFFLYCLGKRLSGVAVGFLLRGCLDGKVGVVKRLALRCGQRRVRLVGRDGANEKRIEEKRTRDRERGNAG
jgi:hypothetical protein